MTKRYGPGALTLGLLLALGGCGPADPPPDAAVVEAGVDSAPDTVADRAVEHAPDVERDLAPDLASDLAPDLDPDLGADLGPDLPPPPPSHICSLDNWCWEHPLPHGNTLSSIWGTAADNVYVSSISGAVLHFDGSQWTQRGSGTSHRLEALWGFGPSAIHAVGFTSNKGRLLAFDGSSWSVVWTASWDYAPLYDVWGTSPSSLYLVGRVGDWGRVLHWDGVDAAIVHKHPDKYSTYYGVGGSGEDDVYCVGLRGRIDHFDGAWAGQASGTTLTLQAADAHDSTFALVVGDNGTVLRNDGSGWQPMATGTDLDFDDVWITSPTEAYAVGTRYDWQSGTTFYHHEVFRYSGGLAWQKIYSFASGAGGSLVAVWAGDGAVFASGASGTVLRDDGSGWRPLSTRLTTRTLEGMWGASATEIYAVGSQTLLLRDQQGWRDVTPPIVAAAYGTRAIWGDGAGELFIAGSGGAVFHRRGTAWEKELSGTTYPLNDIWGSAADNVFTVGQQGIALRYDGSSWSPTATGTAATLYGVWGTSASHLFAVGYSGTLLRYDGTEWHYAASVDIGHRLQGVWGSGPDDVYAVGYFYDSGTRQLVYRYDGTSWARVTAVSEAEYALRGVWGSGASDVYVVGDSGRLLHFDGTGWAAQQSGAGNLYDVWGAAGTVYAVGWGATIIQRSP